MVFGRIVGLTNPRINPEISHGRDEEGDGLSVYVDDDGERSISVYNKASGMLTEALGVPTQVISAGFVSEDREREIERSWVPMLKD